MYHIAICDDEVKMLEDISKRVKNEFVNNGIETKYSCFSDSRNLMDFLEENNVDVLFLDIDMPYFSGMDIAAVVNRKKLNTLIVFVTSYDALVYQTFEYRPFGFVRKSYIEEEIEPLVKRIANELIEQKEEIVVTKGQEIIRIPVADIIYVEAYGNYLNIQKKNEEIKIRETMTAIENELKCKGFIRCHKGYLVNGKYIIKFGNGQLAVGFDENIYNISVGRSYEKDVKRSILELIRG